MSRLAGTGAVGVPARVDPLPVVASAGCSEPVSCPPAAAPGGGFPVPAAGWAVPDPAGPDPADGAPARPPGLDLGPVVAPARLAVDGPAERPGVPLPDVASGFEALASLAGEPGGGR